MREADPDIERAKLYNELHAALLDNPSAAVYTPAFRDCHGSHKTPAVEIVSDSFAGSDGNEKLASLLAVVRAAANSFDPRVKGMAEEWLDSMCDDHALHHLAAAMDEAEEAIEGYAH